MQHSNQLCDFRCLSSTMPKRVLMDQNPTKDNRAKRPALDQEPIAWCSTAVESVASARAQIDWEKLRVKSKSKIVLKDASEKKKLLPKLNFVEVTELSEMKEAIQPLFEYLMKHFEGLPFEVTQAGEKQCSYQNCERKLTNKSHRLCDQLSASALLKFARSVSFMKSSDLMRLNVTSAKQEVIK